MPVVLTQTGVGSSSIFKVNYRIKPVIVTSLVNVIGTATYTLEYTLDDVSAPDFDPNTARWVPVAGAVTNATSTQFGNNLIAMSGVRLRVSAGTGTAVAKINQYRSML